MRKIEDIKDDVLEALIANYGIYSASNANRKGLLEHDLDEVKSYVEELEEKIEELTDANEEVKEQYEAFCQNTAMGHYLAYDVIPEFSNLHRLELTPCEDYEYYSNEDLVEAINDLYQTLKGFKL